ncbi:Uncharacterised protein [Orientia tsutsugamushi str. Gilliam]|uniref:Uncharacterized protein n=2 Tax=Orientia tsutsugamushi str. Gilliam TaxID=1359184 RepID=A0A2U3R3K7_ORITS|nr:hypothetical protein [Orientia tsutsugamushi]SPR07777.1 Uncharacterised protein [Orientia tsutsugamushi str. Gilliam]
MFKCQDSTITLIKAVTEAVHNISVAFNNIYSKIVYSEIVAADSCNISHDSNYDCAIIDKIDNVNYVVRPGIPNNFTSVLSRLMHYFQEPYKIHRFCSSSIKLVSGSIDPTIDYSNTTLLYNATNCINSNFLQQNLDDPEAYLRLNNSFCFGKPVGIVSHVFAGGYSYVKKNLTELERQLYSGPRIMAMLDCDDNTLTSRLIDTCKEYITIAKGCTVKSIIDAINEKFYQDNLVQCYNYQNSTYTKYTKTEEAEVGNNSSDENTSMLSSLPAELYYYIACGIGAIVVGGIYINRYLKKTQCNAEKQSVQSQSNVNNYNDTEPQNSSEGIYAEITEYEDLTVVSAGAQQDDSTA